MSPIVTNDISIPWVSGSVFLHTKTVIGGIRDLDLAIGEQSLRSGRRIILTGAVVVAVSHPTRDFPVGLNEASHRGRQFSFCGCEGVIGFHSLFQNPFLSGGSGSEGVKIFVQVSFRPGRIICLGLRRFP